MKQWAPYPRGSRFQKNDIRPGRRVDSFVDLGLGVLTADRSFPPTDPRKCWDDDAGLKIDLERTILNRWPQEQEDAPSPFPVIPAAAVP